jgi:hypothetical protein
MGLTTLHCKNKCVTKNQAEPRTWTDSLDKRPKLRNMDMRFGLWTIMIILLGDFNTKVGSEDIFKPTIGNESLHEISNDNEVCHI